MAYCPIGHYNYSFQRDLLYTPAATFPDRNLQCNDNWGGLACGECNYSAGYAIKYDTTECVPVDECLTTSVIYSLLILFAVSLLYWIVIMSFIFVLLHFKFDITAGYAYGLLFYYSVLEQWGICITTKPFKFSVLSTAHVRNLGAHAYRKFNAANILVV